MYQYKKNNSLISYGFILGSLFILVLLTKTQVYTLQENFDRTEYLENQKEDKRNEIDRLNNGKKALEDEGVQVDKYLKKIDEAELIEYFYSYMEKINSAGSTAAVKSIKFSEGEINELGFFEAKIDVTLRVSGSNKLKMVLRELTGENAKYKFYIDNIQFPYGTTGPMTVTIPLKIFYK